MDIKAQNALGKLIYKAWARRIGLVDTRWGSLTQQQRADWRYVARSIVNQLHVELPLPLSDISPGPAEVREELEAATAMSIPRQREGEHSDVTERDEANNGGNDSFLANKFIATNVVSINTERGQVGGPDYLPVLREGGEKGGSERESETESDGINRPDLDAS